MMDGERDDISPMPTLKDPMIGDVDSTDEGHSTSILEHIGIIEEDDQEVFVDALEDRPTPISPTSFMTEVSNGPSLTANIMLSSSSHRMVEPTKTRGNVVFEDHPHEGKLNKAVRRLQASTRGRKKKQATTARVAPPYPSHPLSESTPFIHKHTRH